MSVSDGWDWIRNRLQDQEESNIGPDSGGGGGILGHVANQTDQNDPSLLEGAQGTTEAALGPSGYVARAISKPAQLADANSSDGTSAEAGRDASVGQSKEWSLLGYPSAQAAAVAGLKYYNPISIADNTERTGTVIGLPVLGYTYLPPTLNGPAGGTNPPACIGCSAYYHTHAGSDPHYQGEDFSPADRGLAQAPAGGLSGPVTIYLGTPSGGIKMYDPNTGYEGPLK